MKKLLLILFVLLESGYAYAQNYQISGRVTDAATREPLPYVTVVEKGANRFTTTDDNGNFRLNVSGLNAVIAINFIGYKPLEINVTGPILNVQLEAEIQNLDEVVVVAYGTVSQRDLTGSVGVVKAEDISRQQSTSVSQALQGLSSGVQVFNSSGNPGSEGIIYVRGLGSYNANSQPLYVIDGVPSDQGMNMMNPNDVESISILKDASSTALYGSRAANGVVMITTKRGRSERPQISFSSTWSTNTFAVPIPKHAGPERLLELAWEGLYYDALHGTDQPNALPASDSDARAYASRNTLAMYGIPTTHNGETYYVSRFKLKGYKDRFGGNANEPIGLDGKFKYNELEDVFADAPGWDAMYHIPLRQDYNLNVNGQADGGKTRYFFSGSYTDDKGFYMIQRFKRYTARANVSSMVKKWLELGLNLSYTNTGRDNSSRSAGMRTVRVMPSVNAPWLRNIENSGWMYTANGNLIPNMGPYRREWWDQNPLMNSGTRDHNPDDNSFDYSQNDQVQVRTFFEATLTKGLKWRTNFSYANSQANTQTFTSNRYGSAVQTAYSAGTGELTAGNNGNSASKSGNKMVSTTINNLLTYNESFNKIHNISLLAGQEAYSYRWENFSGSGQGIPDLPGLYELSNATRYASGYPSGYRNERSMLSFLAQAQYNYDEKYYLSGSIRADGSSRFHPDNRWGTFWSVAGSWRISDEKFMKGMRSWLSDLRLRASYGYTGNDGLSTNYAYQATYTINDYNGVAAYPIGNLPNATLKWEKNIQFTVGADFRLFGKVFGSIEWYNRESKDLIFGRGIPNSLGMGTSTFNQNVGAMKNSGIELTANISAISRTNFKWDINFNVTTQKNVMTALPDGDIYSGNYRITEGRSRYEFWLLPWAGIDPADGNHMFWKKIFQYDANGEYVRDKKGDPIEVGREITKNVTEISAVEYRHFAGSSIPKAYGSLTNNFRYQNFDFSFMFYYSLGGKMYDSMFRESVILRYGFATLEHDEVWRPGKTDATLGRYRFEAEGVYQDNPDGTRRLLYTMAQNPDSDRFLFKNDYIRLRNIALGYTLSRKVSQKLGIGNLRVYVSGDNLLTFGKAAKRGTDPEVDIRGTAIDGYVESPANVDGRWGPRKTFAGGIQITF